MNCIVKACPYPAGISGLCGKCFRMANDPVIFEMEPCYVDPILPPNFARTLANRKAGKTVHYRLRRSHRLAVPATV